MKKLLFVLLITLLSGGGTVSAADLRLVILDVGMGQSVLLAEEGHGLLVDTGLARYAPQVLARMKSYGVKELDYLLLSHLHPDHAAGYFAMRAAWPDTPVFDNCHIPEDVDSSERETILKVGSALVRDPLRSCLAAGDRLRWRGHELQVLWPESPQGTDLNHNSLVLLFTSRDGARLLIMGDVDKTVEKRLAAALPPGLQEGALDCYVAGHHAAVDSTDPGFLSHMRPEFSIVTVGRDNIYGYPAKETMALLEKHSRTVLRTDRDGELCFVLKGGTCVPCKDLENNGARPAGS